MLVHSEGILFQVLNRLQHSEIYLHSFHLPFPTKLSKTPFLHFAYLHMRLYKVDVAWMHSTARRCGYPSVSIRAAREPARGKLASSSSPILYSALWPNSSGLFIPSLLAKFCEVLHHIFSAPKGYNLSRRRTCVHPSELYFREVLHCGHL